MLFASRRLRRVEEGAHDCADGLARRQEEVAAGTDPRRREAVRLARTRWRGFLVRAEVEFRGSPQRQADLSHLQRRRIRAGHVQGSPDHPPVSYTHLTLPTIYSV